MIPSAFEYERATSVDDAIAKLAATGGSGKLIAGGHSLVPLMKLRLNEPTTLIDIARIPALAGIREHDGLIEIAWRDDRTGNLSQAELFGTDKIDEAVEKAETIK